MRKLVVFITLALISVVALPQKYMTKNGFISFYSHTPLEEIRADNNQVAGIIDVATNEMVFQVLMKSFHFGTDLKKEGTYEVTVSGDMTIHGVTKPLTTQGTIMVTADAMKGSSKFTLTPEDYDISISGVVREKIASQVEVTVEMNYAPMDR
jgi:hypothetical protein